MQGYLTPNDIPAGFTCRVLFIPNNRDWVAQVYGAVQQLTFPYSWTEYGSVTPDEASVVMGEMFDKFISNVRGCKMIGEIMLWSGASAPDPTVLLCDGATYDKVDYPNLYDIIDPVFHIDADTFTVPDLRDRVPIGAGSTYGIGDTGGEAEHTLDVSEMPSHSHTDVGHTHSAELSTLSAAEVPVVPVPVALPGVGVTGSGSANLTNTGGDGAHNNLQPYLALAYYIVAL